MTNSNVDASFDPYVMMRNSYIELRTDSTHRFKHIFHTQIHNTQIPYTDLYLISSITGSIHIFIHISSSIIHRFIHISSCITTQHLKVP